MDYKAMLANARSIDYHKELINDVRKAVDYEEAHRVFMEYINKFPNDDFKWTCGYGYSAINGLRLAVQIRDYIVCEYIIGKDTKPDVVDINIACRLGNIEIVELLVSHYANPTDDNISHWRKVALINGHKNIAYLIDRLCGTMFLQFCKRDTEYFIRVLSNSIKNTPTDTMRDKAKKEIMLSMLDDFNDKEYIAYTIDNLTILKESVEYYISIYKLLHINAENIITTAINYYRSYKDGIKTTDKRTLDGALLVTL